MKYLKIKSEKCIACGKCYLNFPEVFDCSDDGIAFVQEEISQEQIKDAQRAIYECPTRAIELSETSSSN